MKKIRPANTKAKRVGNTWIADKLLDLEMVNEEVLFRLMKDPLWPEWRKRLNKVIESHLGIVSEEFGVELNKVLRELDPSLPRFTGISKKILKRMDEEYKILMANVSTPEKVS